MYTIIKLVDRINKLIQSPDDMILEYRLVCRCKCVVNFDYNGKAFLWGEIYYIEVSNMVGGYIIYSVYGDMPMGKLLQHYICSMCLEIGSEDILSYFKDIPTLREENIDDILSYLS